MTLDARFFIAPEGRTTAPPSHLCPLLHRLHLDGLHEVHGASLEDLAVTSNVSSATVAALEGLVVDLGCGFVAAAAWGRAADRAGPVHARDPGLLAASVEELSVSVRALNCFEREGIRTLGDLVRRTEEQLLHVHNLGRSTLREIRAALEALGLRIATRAAPVSADERGEAPTPAVWPISAPSRDRLAASGITSLAKLAEQSEHHLLDEGLVRLEELLALANTLWRSTGAAFAPVPKRAARLHVDLNLLYPIAGVGWPRDVVRTVAEMDIHRLVGVAAKTRGALGAAGLDEASMDGIERGLWRLGLGLRHRVDPRLEQHADDLADVFALDLSFSAPPASFSARRLEDELDSLLRGLDHDRNVRIAARSFGWDGGGGVPGARVAVEFDLSRERTYQVNDRILRRLHAARAETPLLEAAAHFVGARLPAWAADLESGLSAKGLCRDPFRLEGLAHAARERGIPVDFLVVEESTLRVAVPCEAEGRARALLRRAHRAVAAGDNASLDRVLRELGGAAAGAAPSSFVGAGTLVPATVSESPEVGGAGSATDAPGSTWEMAQWMLSRARERGLLSASSPWSVIELGWQASDLETLRRWGQVGQIDSPRELTQRRDVVDGTTLTGRDALALVFLAYAMDVGRREAHEGELWPFVRKSLSYGLQERLFTESGMLRAWIRDALEVACPNRGVRHVFGQDGIQAWIRTVFLQFGVSEAGWERLPWWLSGHQRTVTIDDLLAPEGPLHSRSFTDLWKVLQHGRFGPRNEARLRRELQDLESPWLSATDVGRIAASAQARPEVVRIDGEQAEAPESEVSVSGLLSEPRLRWDAGETPRFEVALAADASARLKVGEHVLVLHGHGRLPLVRDAEGGSRIASGPVLLEPRQAAIAFELVRDGEAVFQGIFPLCDTDEELLLFDLSSGRRLDAWGPVPPERSVALLTRSDLTVTPEPPRWFSVFGGGWKLWRFDRGLPAGTTITLGSETLWTPLHRDSSAPTPRGRASIIGVGRWGETVKVRLEMESGFEPVALRLGAHAYDVNVADGKHVATVVLDPSIQPTVRARVVAISRGRRTVVPVQLELGRTWGAARQCPGGRWEPLRPDDVLDPADLGWNRLLVSSPPMWGVPHDELAILEGGVFQARPRSAERRLGASLHGLGAPLILCRGPYNRVEQPISLAAAVVRTGLLAGVRCDAGDLHLRLGDPVDATEEHSVWLWDPGQEAPKPVPASRVRCGGEEWRVFGVSWTPLACAVAYRGVWLGACFVDPYAGPAEMAALAQATENWRSLALWLRWWRAPVLREPLATAAEGRALQEPVPTLSAWLGSAAGLPQGLSLPLEDASWPTVVQHFFWGWQPSPLQAASLIGGLGLLSGDPVTDLREGWKAFDDLLSVHPVLLALIARDGVRTLCPQASPDEARGLLRNLRDRIAGLDDHTSDDEWRSARTRLLQSAAKSMQVDTGFIDPGLLREARELASGGRPRHDNLRVALVVGPLRRFIAAVLIHEFAQAI